MRKNKQKSKKPVRQLIHNQVYTRKRERAKTYTYGSGFLPEVSEDQECCCCSLTQLTWAFAREGGRQRRVCVCLSFPPQYEICLLSSAIGTACDRVCLQNHHLPCGMMRCLNPKFEGMGCCVTFIFVLLCVLLRFCFSVPMRKCSKYVFCFCNGNV